MASATTVHGLSTIRLRKNPLGPICDTFYRWHEVVLVVIDADPVIFSRHAVLCFLYPEMVRRQIAMLPSELLASTPPRGNEVE